MRRINENIVVYYGSDHAIGAFIDICDKRWAEHPLDFQGEGFVLEHCTNFGFTNNLIGAVENDLRYDKDGDRIIPLCNKYIESLPAPESQEVIEKVKKYGNK